MSRADQAAKGNARPLSLETLRAGQLVGAPYLAHLSDTQLKAKAQLNVMSDLRRFQAGQEKLHTRTCVSAKWKGIGQSVVQEVLLS